MFLTKQKELQIRFQEHLGPAKKIDIATAWATSGTVLEMLEKAVEERARPVRIITGISGNATEPDALERLNKIGTLRLAAESDRLFHAKVYIFQGLEQSVAWIGSANFTRGGFESNEEAVCETEDPRTVTSAADWFDARWSQCGELKPTDIEDYRQRWKDRQPSEDMHRIVSPPSLPTPTGDWVSLSFFGRVRANPYPIRMRYKKKESRLQMGTVRRESMGYDVRVHCRLAIPRGQVNQRRLSRRNRGRGCSQPPFPLCGHESPQPAGPRAA